MRAGKKKKKKKKKACLLRSIHLSEEVIERGGKKKHKGKKGNANFFSFFSHLSSPLA